MEERTYVTDFIFAFIYVAICTCCHKKHAARLSALGWHNSDKETEEQATAFSLPQDFQRHASHIFYPPPPPPPPPLSICPSKLPPKVPWVPVGTPLYGLYGDVPLDRVCLLALCPEKRCIISSESVLGS